MVVIDINSLVMSNSKVKAQKKHRHLPPATDRGHDVLIALRRIIRAIDLQSKRIAKASGLTPPQILILRAIQELGEVTSKRVSEQVSLSQATVTTILDRLEQRGLIERYRSAVDRRIVHAKLTAEGRKAFRKSPPLLDEKFIQAFSQRDPADQQMIIGMLEEVAEMLGGGDLDASPILDVNPPDDTKPKI